MKIYIAAPYTADTLEEREANVARAVEVAVRLLEKGYAVYVPHLLHFIDLKAKEMGVYFPESLWINIGLKELSGCDTILILGVSPGVERERQFALQNGIPVYFGKKRRVGNG